jgi:hypothetical protein
MMTLSASSAFAASADQELIRVVYDRAGNEYATDLGNINTLLASSTPTKIAGNGTAGLVAYFAIDKTTNQLWVSGSTSAPSVINGTSGGLTTLKSGVTSVYSQYGATNTNYTGLASAINSYKNKMSATQGTMANAINSATKVNTEASLTAIIAAGAGSVTQNLYFWNDGLTTVAANKIGVAVATITTSFDGSSTVTTAATPIPPAFFLMGSGLLGMFGLRRKNKVA